MKLFGRHLYRTMFGLAQVIDLLEAITDLELVMPDEKTLIVNKKQ